MATFQKSPNQHLQPDTAHTPNQRSSHVAAKIGSLIRKLMGMLLAMASGMALFYLLILLMRTSSSYGAMFEPGTDLYAIGMAVFMTVPTWIVAQCGNHNARASGNC